MRRVLAVVVAASIALSTSSAFAFENQLEVQIFGFSAPTFVDRSLNLADDGMKIDAIAGNDVRLVGNGTLSGGGMRAVGHLDRLRIGYEEAVFIASGLDVKTGPVPDGFSTSHGNIWGMRFELSLGRDLVSEDAPHDAIVPYVDLRAGIELVTTKVQLHSTQFGSLGYTEYNLWSPYFGPRIGARVPLGEKTFFDVSGCLNILGVERGSLAAGLGVAF